MNFTTDTESTENKFHYPVGRRRPDKNPLSQIHLENLENEPFLIWQYLLPNQKSDPLRDLCASVVITRYF